MLLSTTGQIASASKVVKVSGDSWVFFGDEGWVKHGEELIVAEHPFEDTNAELLHLFADAMEEGVAAPSAYQHDGVHWHTVEAHAHGGPGSHGVGSYFIRVVAKCVSAH